MASHDLHGNTSWVGVTDCDHFVTQVTELTPEEQSTAASVWQLWRQTDQLLVYAEPWVTQQGIGAERPFLLADVEHDDPSSGAILFDNVRTMEIGSVRSQKSDRFSFERIVENDHASEADGYIDISPDDDYIDDPRMMWVPREYSTIFVDASD